MVTDDRLKRALEIQFKLIEEAMNDIGYKVLGNNTISFQSDGDYLLTITMEPNKQEE